MILCPCDPMFVFDSDSEYRKALMQANERIMSVGAAYNLVRFQCPIEFLYQLARERRIRSWGVVSGEKVGHFRVSMLDVVAYGIGAAWINQYSDLGVKGLISEAQFLSIDKAVKALAEAGLFCSWVGVSGQSAPSDQSRQEINMAPQN